MTNTVRDDALIPNAEDLLVEISRTLRPHEMEIGSYLRSLLTRCHTLIQAQQLVIKDAYANIGGHERNLERLAGDIEIYREDCVRAEAELSAALARAQDNARDAERYRWWKANITTEAEFDTAIDAAIAARSGENCNHEWVSADNEKVKGCEMCIKCHSARAKT
jgi:hypothetical protein